MKLTAAERRKPWLLEMQVPGGGLFLIARFPNEDEARARMKHTRAEATITLRVRHQEGTK